MKTFYWIIAIVGIFLVIAWGYSGTRGGESLDANVNLGDNMEKFSLTSPAFEPGGQIPEKYTCDGDNVSPPLEISNVPENTESLALIVTDPDIPQSVKDSRGIQEFVHWVSFNIRADSISIPEGDEPGTAGDNTAGNAGYTGPCPPDRDHRYIFTLYALDTALDLSEGSTRDEVLDAMNGHILDQTELIGRYERVNAD